MIMIRKLRTRAYVPHLHVFDSFFFLVYEERAIGPILMVYYYNKKFSIYISDSYLPNKAYILKIFITFKSSKELNINLSFDIVIKRIYQVQRKYPVKSSPFTLYTFRIELQNLQM